MFTRPKSILIYSFCITLLLILTAFKRTEALELSVGSNELLEIDVQANNSQNAASQGEASRSEKTGAALEKKELRITAGKDKIKVGIGGAPEENEEKGDVREETRNSSWMKIPAQLKAEDQNGGAQDNPAEQKKMTPMEQFRLKQQEQIEQIRAKRKLRVSENVEIYLDENSPEEKLFIKSRENKAEIMPGVEFIIDPETNSIFLNNPKGEPIELNHLPDQAVQRLLAIGAIMHDEDAGKIKLGFDQNLEIIYLLETIREERLLGLFKRDIPYRIALNDNTGAISQDKIQGSFVDKFLDLLSF